MINNIKKFISLTNELNVLVIGETIIDEFIPVHYEGQSMKSFCPVFRLAEGDKQVQQGGTSAIAAHLKPFVKNLTLITNKKKEIVKTRYFDVNGGKKHIEINKFDNKEFGEIKVNTSDYDVVIVADFGHGFCDQLNITDGFCLMTQTNSNNFGFNRVSKWKNHKKKSVCIDLREASLQMNAKIQSPSKTDIQNLYNYELQTENLFVTLGKKGSVFFDGKDYVEQQTYKTQIVDTIGAGDAFFGFSCLLTGLKDQITIEDYMFIPSLAASLTTTWLCNEQNVSPQNLIEHGKKQL